MATRYYYFQAEAFDLAFVQSRVPAAAATVQVAPSPGGTSFLIVSADDTFQADLFAAMTDEGFTFIFSSLVAPPAFGQSRFYGALAADPASPPFPLPAAGDQYWNTTTLVMRVYNGVAWVNPPGTSDTAVLGFGAGNVNASTTTRFLYPWYDDSLAQTTVIQYRAPRAGTLRNLRVRQNVPAGNANLIVYAVRVNGVVTFLLVSMASTATDGSDLVNTVAVAAGDLIDIRVTKVLATGAAVTDVAASVEFA
jgi:hypothetical protein